MLINFIKPIEVEFGSHFLIPNVRSVDMFEKPEMMKQLLVQISVGRYFESEQIQLMDYYLICEVLSRPQCRDFLIERYLWEDIVNISDHDKAICLILLLENYVNICKEEILEALQLIPEVEKYLATVFNKTLITKPKTVKIILDLCFDISKFEDKIFLLNMEPGESVHIIVYRIQIRETVKRLIDATPDLDRSGTIVPHELYHDRLYNATASKSTINRYGSYLPDCSEHGQFDYQGENFALNFSVPFLLECGFPVKRDLLSEYLNQKAMHQQCVRILIATQKIRFINS